MIINLSKSTLIPLCFNTLTVEEFRSGKKKGWHFSYVYSFEEMKNVYILLMIYPYENLSKFVASYIASYVKSKKNEYLDRKVLEILNAFVNFNWLHKNSENRYELNRPYLFKQESLGKPITNDEVKVFREVFFSYPLFKDFLGLYTDDIENINVEKHSHPIFSYSMDNKYTNCFFSNLTSGTEILYLPEKNEIGGNNAGRTRFWDVFVSWAQHLQLMEKLNSTTFNIYLHSGGTFACSYFLSNDDLKLPDLYEYLTTHYPLHKMIDLNVIVMNLCFTYRKRLEDVKQYIIDEYIKRNECFNLIRTSEIFINKSEKRTDAVLSYPKYKSSYISHIIVN